MTDPSTTDTDHLEGRIWAVASRVGFLWLDRALTRLLPLALVALPTFLVSETVRTHDGLVMVLMIGAAGLWGIVDLARGIELDYRHKERTLRDCIIQSLQTETDYSEGDR